MLFQAGESVFDDVGAECLLYMTRSLIAYISRFLLLFVFPCT